MTDLDKVEELREQREIARKALISELLQVKNLPPEIQTLLQIERKATENFRNAYKALDSSDLSCY